MKELTAWWYSQSRGSSRSVTWRITVPSMLEHIYAGITDQSMAAFPGSICLPPPTQELTTTLHLSNSQVFCNMGIKPGVPRSTWNNLRRHKIQDFMEGILPDLYSSHTKYTSTAPTLFKLSPSKIASHGHVVWVLHMFVKLASSVSKLQLCSCYNCKYLRYFSTGSRPIQFQEHGISPLHPLKSSHHTDCIPAANKYIRMSLRCWARRLTTASYKKAPLNPRTWSSMHCSLAIQIL